VCVPWTKSSTKLNRPGKAPRERAAVVTRLLALADLVAADGVARELTKESLQTTNGTLHRVLDQAKGSKHLADRGVRVLPGVPNKTPAKLVSATAVVEPPQEQQTAKAERWPVAMAKLLELANTVAPGGELVLGAEHRVGDWALALRLARQEGHPFQVALAAKGCRVIPGAYQPGVRGQAPARLLRA
jgi:hypothetical protein